MSSSHSAFSKAITLQAHRGWMGLMAFLKSSKRALYYGTTDLALQGR